MANTDNENENMCDEDCGESQEEEGKVLADNKDILFFGEISPQAVGGFSQALEIADRTPGFIRITICSMGGWVEGGFHMYDLIQNTKNPVVTIAGGAVYSAAIMPFEAGDYRFMYQNARMFFHPMFINAGSDRVSTLHSAVLETNKMAGIYCRCAAGRSGKILTPDDVQKLCERETYLSSNECLKLKLCDGIITANRNKIKDPKMVEFLRKARIK